MKTILPLAALAAAFATGAHAQTTWFYGASDNSANFGVTADSSSAITWMDGWAYAAAPDKTLFGSQALQVNRPSLIGEEQSIMLFGFGGTGLASADVSSALLYIRQDFSFPTGTPNTWNIVGLSSGNSDWDNSSMTWNDINGASAGDWTGGTLLGSLNGVNYGTFQDLGTSTDGNLSIDLTAAMKAYLDGTISGIAFVNSTPGDTFTGSDYALIAYSNDNLTASNRPGLLVTAVPEPSSALLGGLGILLLLRRRRA